VSRFKRLCQRVQYGTVLKGKQAKAKHGPKHKPDFGHFDRPSDERLRKLKPK